MFARASRHGYATVLAEDIPEEFKNKKIIVEDLDAEGKTINREILNERDKDLFLCSMVAEYGILSVTPKEYLRKFNKRELEIIEKYIWRYDFYLTKDKVEYFKKLFNQNSLEKIEFALKISGIDELTYFGSFVVSMNSPYHAKIFTLEEAFEFVENRDGIYYAVNNEGEKHWDFIDKPTKKQAQYQRRKHGNRIVFLSFMDWKEYAVSENELE